MTPSWLASMATVTSRVTPVFSVMYSGMMPVKFSTGYQEWSMKMVRVTGSSSAEAKEARESIMRTLRMRARNRLLMGKPPCCL